MKEYTQLEERLTLAEGEKKNGKYDLAEQTCTSLLAQMQEHEYRTDEVLNTLRAKALIILAEVRRKNGKLGEAEQAANEAREAARQVGNAVVEGKALSQIGALYENPHEFTQALEWYQKALVLLENADSPADTAAVHNSIGSVYRLYSHPSHSIPHYVQSLTIYKSLGLHESVCSVMMNLGVVYGSLSDYSTAQRYLYDALTLSQHINHRSLIAQAFANLGSSYTFQSNFTKALDYQGRALTLFEELHMSSEAATVMSNIGTIYSSLSDPMKALDYYIKALAIQEKTGNSSKVAIVTASIGNAYLAMEDYTHGLEFYYKALQLFERNGNREATAGTYSNIGEACTHLHRYSEAMEYYHKALSLNQAIENRIGISHTLCNIGALYANSNYENHSVSLAEDFFKQAVAISEAIGTFQDSLYIHQALAQLFVETGIVEKAFYHLQKSHELERIIQLDSSKKLAEQFDYERKIAVERARREERERVVAELLALNASLEEANREKNEVLGIVAHDLKNPLSGILLSAESMKRYYKGFTEQQFEKHLSMISSAAEHMKAIVLKLLDIQFVESGRLTIVLLPTNLLECLEPIMLEYSQKAAAKNIRLRLLAADEPLLVPADKHAFREILENLISNAIKFSPNDSEVTIIGERTASSSVRIRVRDQGPGISAEDLGNLFKKFTRLSAKPTGGEHSTGLGLSIVKKLVEAMNGTVWCESTQGNGATFVVEFKEHT